jgi:4-hydroxybenzoate polyprenyltransferase
MFFSASRFHIVLIAGLGTLTFGWLLCGVHEPWSALCAALDWWILDVGNKLSDLSEDRVNSPEEARWVERHRRGLGAACWGALGASLVPTALFAPWLVPLRMGFQLLGLLYNFPWLPGRRRLKNLYLWKNTTAGVLFLMSVMGYPLVVLPTAREVDLAYLIFMGAFFFFLEHSFEIIYDFKDVEGDRRERVRTYPAVHGERGAARVFYGVVGLSAAMLVAGACVGVLGFREVIILLAPAVQIVAFHVYRRRGYRAQDTVTITHLGSIQLLIYNAYVWAGLPIPPWA